MPSACASSATEPEALGQGGDDAHVRHRVVDGKLLVGHGADETDVVAETEASRVALEPAPLTTAVVDGAVAAVVTRDDHREVGELWARS